MESKILDGVLNVDRGKIRLSNVSNDFEFQLLCDDRLMVVTKGDINVDSAELVGTTDMIFYDNEWYARSNEDHSLFWWYKDRIPYELLPRPRI